MPFVISKTAANILVSTMIGTSGEYGIVEKIIPITREVVQPVTETSCGPIMAKKYSPWKGNYYEQELYCHERVISKRQTELIGHYIVYNNNGEKITIKKPL
jgi:hypothetical protein